MKSIVICCLDGRGISSFLSIGHWSPGFVPLHSDACLDGRDVIVKTVEAGGDHNLVENIYGNEALDLQSASSWMTQHAVKNAPG